MKRLANILRFIHAFAITSFLVLMAGCFGYLLANQEAIAQCLTHDIGGDYLSECVADSYYASSQPQLTNDDTLYFTR